MSAHDTHVHKHACGGRDGVRVDMTTLLRRQMELHTSMRQPPRTAAQLQQLRATLHRYGDFVATVHAIAAQLSTQPHTVFQCLLHLQRTSGNDGSCGQENNNDNNSDGAAAASIIRAHDAHDSRPPRALASFDQQHGEGDVPMHQAKVLARAQAVALTPRLQGVLAREQLLQCAAMSDELRSTLRVKVEDGNDLHSATQTLRDMTDYLDCIDACAGGSSARMFALYMAEDAAMLRRLLRECGVVHVDDEDVAASEGAASARVTAAASLRICGSSSSGGGNNDDDEGDDADASMHTLRPAQLPVALQTACATALSTTCAATLRLSAARRIATIVTQLAARNDDADDSSHDKRSGHSEQSPRLLVRALCVAAPVVDALTRERRSALCRAGCDVVVAFAMCAPLWCSSSSSSTSHNNNTHTTSANGGAGGVLATTAADAATSCAAAATTAAMTVSGMLAQWVHALARGVYVTVAAIATACEAALRCLVVHTRAHDSVVAALTAALRVGAQTSLRTCCLGCLAVCVAAVLTPQQDERSATRTSDDGHDRAAMTRLLSVLLPVAVQYVGVGDARCRQRARALAAVLLHLAMRRGSGSNDVLTAVCGVDGKARALLQAEAARLAPYVCDVHALDQLLFADNNTAQTRMTPATATLTHTTGTCGSNTNDDNDKDKDAAADECASRPAAKLVSSLRRKIALTRQAQQQRQLQQQHNITSDE